MASSAADEALARDFDLRALDAAFLDDPYPTYRALRVHSPVKRLSDGSLFLSRHADVAAVYRDAARFSSDKRAEFAPKYGESPLYEHHTTSLVFNDAPAHPRVRRRIVGALTPAAVAHLEADLVRLCDRLLEPLAEAGGGDLVAGFAAAIPVEVIGNLLGVPAGARGPLRDWSLAILGALEPVVSDAAAARGNEAVSDFLDFLRDLVADRRARPGDAERDVLTRLLDSEGEPLSEAELLHNCIFLLNAGHETTTNLIANALEALDRFPDERRRLLDAPPLIATAVEEALRFESPNQLGNRCAAQDAAIGGVAVPRGTRITLGIGAANRDPAAFADPDRFDVARAPNRHLAFGSGVHQCAGLGLARLEGKVALGRFLARFPRYRVERAARGGRARFRGFSSIIFTGGPDGS